MPVRERRSGDERPLFKPINEQRLIGPVSGTRGEQEQSRGAAQAEAAPEAGGSGHQGGAVSQAVDRALENNWVYPSVANKAKETGLLDRADKLFDKLKAQLSR